MFTSQRNHRYGGPHDKMRIVREGVVGISNLGSLATPIPASSFGLNVITRCSVLNNADATFFLGVPTTDGKNLLALNSSLTPVNISGSIYLTIEGY